MKRTILLVATILFVVWCFSARAQDTPTTVNGLVITTDPTVAVFGDAAAFINWPKVAACARRSKTQPPERGGVNYFERLAKWENDGRLIAQCRVLLWTRHEVLREFGALADAYPPVPMFSPEDFK